MNSRYVFALALCGLLMCAHQGVQSANLGPQLLPLPAMAQSAPATANNAANQPGEVQYIQPSIVLTADRDTVNRVDMDAPPMQTNLPIEVEIVQSSPDSKRREANDINVAVPTRVSLEEVKYKLRAGDGSTTTIEPVVTTPNGKDKDSKSGASQIGSRLFPTIMAALATISLLSLARK